MIKLRDYNVNTPALSERIFKDRWHSCPHYIDWERFRRLASRYEDGMSYLDVGCFNSPMPGEIKRRCPEVRVVAIDHAPAVINVMSKIFPEVDYRCVDIKTLPFESEEFDYVVAGEILEHMWFPESLIKELFRVTKKGGYVAISTPFEEPGGGNEEHLWSFNKIDMDSLLVKYASLEYLDFEQPGFKTFIIICRKNF